MRTISSILLLAALLGVLTEDCLGYDALVREGGVSESSSDGTSSDLTEAMKTRLGVGKPRRCGPMGQGICGPVCAEGAELEDITNKCFLSGSRGGMPLSKCCKNKALEQHSKVAKVCRSFRNAGVCASKGSPMYPEMGSTTCGNGETVINKDHLLSRCNNEGDVCCPWTDFSAEQLEREEESGDDVDNPFDDYTPEYRNNIKDLLENMNPGVGEKELPCWGNQVPYDCGEAFKRGKSLGPRQCIKWNGNGKPVTVELACAFKKLSDAAAAAGHTVYLNSGFRTNAEQLRLRRQNCGSGKCRPATARAGYSNHQNGIAVDLKVAAYPRLFQWLRDNATKYGFVRTVPSENWHWEYRPGFRCNAFVSYRCNSPPMILEKCRGHDVRGSPAEGLFCKQRKACPGQNTFVPGACPGNSYCCLPIPCTKHSDLSCVFKSEATYGYHTGECPGELVCGKPQPTCSKHPELKCVEKSEAVYGYHSGECPGRWVCAKPPTQCRGDPSRICQQKSMCGLYGSDSGLCDGSLTCCVTKPPKCKVNTDRFCLSPADRNCVLYGTEAGQCPGSSTCCKTEVACKGRPELRCGDPTKVPEGVQTIRGLCPGSSVCFDQPPARQFSRPSDTHLPY